MINDIYNSRLGAIKTYQFSAEWEQNAIPFLRSHRLRNKTIIFHKLCDLQSETAADESCIQERLQGRNVFDERDFGMSI